jgi:hypothetical protein
VSTEAETTASVGQEQGGILYRGEDRGFLACAPRRGVAESDSLSLSPARAGGGRRTRRAGPAYQQQRRGGAEMGREKGNGPVSWAAWRKRKEEGERERERELGWHWVGP